jgi:hypothetical protein
LNVVTSAPAAQYIQAPATQFIQAPSQVVQAPAQVMSAPLIANGTQFVSAPAGTQFVSAPTQFSQLSIPATQQVVTQPATQFVVAPAFTAAQYQVLRSGDYWFVYTDSKGERSWMLHLGALSNDELAFAQRFPQMVQDRLRSLFSGTAEGGAYANPNYTPIYGAITGTVSLVNLNTPVSGPVWTLRTLEGYLLAPFDPSTTESLGFSRIPTELQPFMYPKYYQRV